MTSDQRHPSLRSALDRPFAVMGVVNITPDSFSDGGRFLNTDDAVAHGLELVGEGADVLDIGGESTRPGAEPVDADEEVRRVIPVIERLARRVNVPICVDTTKSTVAERALDAGAAWLNDISAGRFDPAMADVAARRSCPIVLMHSRETPRTMQQAPTYGDVVDEVEAELLDAVERFRARGVSAGNIVLDPGIGFGKRFEDNLTILNELPHLAAHGFPILVGTSRKAFIGHITGKPAEGRLFGTVGSVAAAYVRGARIFRVHDVAPAVDALRVLAAVLTHERAPEGVQARA